MKQQILYSPQELRAQKEIDPIILVDCRFDLGDTGAGYRDYLEAHIPGAVYAHLDNDLSGPVTADSGRHPLPDHERFAAFLARIGWQPGMKLVAYDNAGGAIAARLWWLMMYFGHDCASLLDGGVAAWKSAGYELEGGPVTRAGTAPVILNAKSDLVISTDQVVDSRGSDEMVLVDVRASERYNGQEEPIDPVAGHIPGSLNYPLQLSLAQNGRFKPAEQIRKSLLALSNGRPPENIVYMCGSGVTACHTIFASEVAGLKGSKLYAGSWSEWIRDPDRPVEPATP